MSDDDLGKNRNTKIKYEAVDEENGLLFTGNFLIQLMKGILTFLYRRDVSREKFLKWIVFFSLYFPDPNYTK